MSAVDFLAQEKIWFDKPRYDEAERRFYEHMNGSPQTTKVPTLSHKSSLKLRAFSSHIQSETVVLYKCGWFTFSSVF